MNKQPPPKVSVITITYNHEEYIRDTLDSFVMQSTDFPFEVIVADDASTDNTQAIIKEYTKKYPQIFIPILRGKNIGAWENFTDALSKSTGKYVALCEGDDYWTDQTKLQKQADFLDKNPSNALCFHPVMVYFEDEEEKGYIFPNDKSTFTIEKLLKRNFIQTNSVMYRRQDYTNLPIGILPGDWYMHIYHSQFGKIGYINEVMSVYRRHATGLWRESRRDKDKVWIAYGQEHLQLHIELLKLFQKDELLRQITLETLSKTMNDLYDVDRRKGTNLIRGYITNKSPETVELLIKSQAEDIQRLKKTVANDSLRIHQLNNAVTRRDKTITEKEAKILELKGSVYEKAKKFMNKALISKSKKMKANSQEGTVK